MIARGRGCCGTPGAAAATGMGPPRGGRTPINGGRPGGGPGGNWGRPGGGPGGSRTPRNKDIVLTISVKFRYSQKATTIWVIFPFLFEIS